MAQSATFLLPHSVLSRNHEYEDGISGRNATKSLFAKLHPKIEQMKPITRHDRTSMSANETFECDANTEFSAKIRQSSRWFLKVATERGRKRTSRCKRSTGMAKDDSRVDNYCELAKTNLTPVHLYNESFRPERDPNAGLRRTMSRDAWNDPEEFVDSSRMKNGGAACLHDVDNSIEITVNKSDQWVLRLFPIALNSVEIELRHSSLPHSRSLANSRPSSQRSKTKIDRFGFALFKERRESPFYSNQNVGTI